jgi:ribonuclease P protein component
VSTIKSSREIDAMFRSARRTAHPLVIALAFKTLSQRGQSGRVAYIAGKKLGGAVVRNRCRRVLRESARRCGGPWAAWDVALVARPGTGGASADALDEAVRSVLTRAGVL